MLLAAFNQVVTKQHSGAGPGLGLFRIGKSASSMNCTKVLVPPRGLFASGKF